MDYPQSVVDAAREYVAAIERCESTGSKRHDSKRQLAHDEFIWQMQLAGNKTNMASFDERGNATNLAYKIVRWLGSSY
jgi:hypothetical protein